MQASTLPRLLYFGDVPIESTVAGSALLYRLLDNYPADKLHIIETNIASSNLKHRLPDVPYQVLPYAYKPLLKNRFFREYNSFLFAVARYRTKALKEINCSFQAEAVLTVAHGISWLTAAAFAEKFNLPLHLIVHDDWISFTPAIQGFKKLLEQKFKGYYQQAKSRFCVSPYMADKYKERYGIDGIVLYPSRGTDVPEVVYPPNKVKDQILAKHFVYAGSIHSQGQANNLITLARILETIGGKLFVYTPLDLEASTKFGLNRKNIIIKSVIPSRALIAELQSTMDILFVPMNFDLDAKNNMELCFPSKLADYTAIGLPLLIWGPSYCSAVQWSKQNPNVAAVVEEQSVESLEKAVQKLVNLPDYRYELAMNALTTGQRYFSHTNVQEKFFCHLRNSKPTYLG